MGLRVPFPPNLSEAEYQAAVEEIFRQIAAQKALAALSVAIGVPMIVWMIVN